MYDALVIDTSNLYMRAYYTGSSLTTVLSDGTQLVTGGIYNFLRMVNSLERTYLKDSTGKVYFIFDNSSSGISRRKEIDPDYKSNRTKRDDAFYRSIDLLQEILLNYREGWYCVKCTGYEADDLVSPVLGTLKGESVLLVSQDMDWMRDISEKVHVAKYEKDSYRLYTPSVFREMFGFQPSRQSVILYKSIRGDHSDNIPPAVKGLPEKTLMTILNQCSSVNDLLISVRRGDEIENLSNTFRQKILDCYPRMKLNEELVGFQEISEEDLLSGIYPCAFHPFSLKILYKELGFQISKIDSRLMRFWDKDEVKEDPKNFFKPAKLKRS